MAVRFDTEEPFTTTSGLPPSAVFTVCCWGYLTADRNQYTEFVSLGNSASPSTYCSISTNADGTSVGIFDLGAYSGTGVGQTAMTTGVWWFLAMAVNGADGSFLRASGHNALTATTVANLSPPTPGAMSLGNYVGSGPYWLNGRLAAVKMWAARLTADEVAAERACYLPMRTQNLLRVHPFLRAETVDYSGNGNTLSGGAGTTTEDGPPIPWGRDRIQLFAPPAAAGTEGTLAASGLVPTASVTASLVTAGQVAGSAPAPTATVTASSSATGALAGAAPVPALSATGTATASGSLGTTGPVPAAALTGAASAAGALTGTATLPAATAAATITAAGDLAATAPQPVLSAAATTLSSGALTAAAPAPTVGVTGTTLAGGTLTASAALPVVSLAADAATGVLGAQAPLPGTTVTGTAYAGGTLTVDVSAPVLAVAAAVLTAGQVTVEAALPAVAFTTAGVLPGVLAATAPQASSALQAATRTSGVLAASAPLPAVDLFSTVPVTPGSMTPVYRAAPNATGTARHAPSATGTHRGAPTATRG